MKNSSLSYSNYLFVQQDDLSIRAWNISFNAENTKVIGDGFTVFQSAIPGTRIKGGAIQDGSQMVFGQLNGGDIMVASYDTSQTPPIVSTNKVPIPE